MNKYTVMIPLIAHAVVEVKAEDESEAIGKAEIALDRGEIDTDGYDTENIDEWWIDQVSQCTL